MISQSSSSFIYEPGLQDLRVRLANIMGTHLSSDPILHIPLSETSSAPTPPPSLSVSVPSVPLVSQRQSRSLGGGSIFRVDVTSQGNTVLSVPTAGGPATIQLPTSAPRPQWLNSSPAKPSSYSGDFVHLGGLGFDEGPPGMGGTGASGVKKFSIGDDTRGDHLVEGLEAAARELRSAAEIFTKNFTSPPSSMTLAPSVSKGFSSSSSFPVSPPPPPRFFSNTGSEPEEDLIAQTGSGEMSEAVRELDEELVAREKRSLLLRSMQGWIDVLHSRPTPFTLPHAAATLFKWVKLSFSLHTSHGGGILMTPLRRRNSRTSSEVYGEDEEWEEDGGASVIDPAVCRQWDHHARKTAMVHGIKLAMPRPAIFLESSDTARLAFFRWAFQSWKSISASASARAASAQEKRVRSTQSLMRRIFRAWGVFSAKKSRNRIAGDIIEAGVNRGIVGGCIVVWRKSTSLAISVRNAREEEEERERAAREAEEARERAAREAEEARRTRIEKQCTALHLWLEKWVSGIVRNGLRDWRNWASVKEESRRERERLTLWADSHLKRVRCTRGLASWMLWSREHTRVRKNIGTLQAHSLARRLRRTLGCLQSAAAFSRAVKTAGCRRTLGALLRWRDSVKSRNHRRMELVSAGEAFLAWRTSSILASSLMRWRARAHRGALATRALAVILSKRLMRACVTWRERVLRCRNARERARSLARSASSFLCRKALTTWRGFCLHVSWKALRKDLLSQHSFLKLQRCLERWNRWAYNKNVLQASYVAAISARASQMARRALAALARHVTKAVSAKKKLVAAEEAAAAARARLLGKCFMAWASWLKANRAARVSSREAAAVAEASRRRKVLGVYFQAWAWWCRRKGSLKKIGVVCARSHMTSRAGHALGKWRDWAKDSITARRKNSGAAEAIIQMRGQGALTRWMRWCQSRSNLRALIVRCREVIWGPAASRRCVRAWSARAKIWGSARVEHERASLRISQWKAARACALWVSHTRSSFLLAAMCASVAEKSLVLRAARGLRLWRDEATLLKRVRQGAAILARKLWEAQCSRLKRWTFSAWVSYLMRCRLARISVNRRKFNLSREVLFTWHSQMLVVRARRGPDFRLLRKAFGGWKTLWGAAAIRRKAILGALSRILHALEHRNVIRAWSVWVLAVGDAAQSKALLKRVFRRWVAFTASHAAKRRDLVSRGDEWLTSRMFKSLLKWGHWAAQARSLKAAAQKLGTALFHRRAHRCVADWKVRIKTLVSARVASQERGAQAESHRLSVLSSRALLFVHRLRSKASARRALSQISAAVTSRFLAFTQRRSLLRWSAWTRGVRLWRLFASQSLQSALSARAHSSLLRALARWRAWRALSKALEFAHACVVSSISPAAKLSRALRIWRGRAASGVGRERTESLFQAYLRGKWLGLCFDKWVGYITRKREWRWSVATGSRALLLNRGGIVAVRTWRATANRTRAVRQLILERRTFFMENALKRWRRVAQVAVKARWADRLSLRRLLRVCWVAWATWARARGRDWREGGKKSTAAKASEELRGYLRQHLGGRVVRKWREEAKSLSRARDHRASSDRRRAARILAAWLAAARGERAWKSVCSRARVFLLASLTRRALGVWRREVNASVVARAVQYSVAVLLPQQFKARVFAAWALWAFKNRALRARIAGLRAVRLERVVGCAIGRWHWMGLARARRGRILGGLVQALQNARDRMVLKALARWAREVIRGKLGEEAAAEHASRSLKAKAYARWRVDTVLGRARRSGIASVLARKALRHWARVSLLPTLTFVHSPLPLPLQPQPLTLSFCAPGEEEGSVFGRLDGWKWRQGGDFPAFSLTPSKQPPNSHSSSFPEDSYAIHIPPRRRALRLGLQEDFSPKEVLPSLDKNTFIDN